MRKGDTVFYTTNGGKGSVVRARVETMHRDGSVSVVALFDVKDGKDQPCYLGFKYRMHADQLRTSA